VIACHLTMEISGSLFWFDVLFAGGYVVMYMLCIWEGGGG